MDRFFNRTDGKGYRVIGVVLNKPSFYLSLEYNISGPYGFMLILGGLFVRIMFKKPYFDAGRF